MCLKKARTANQYEKVEKGYARTSRFSHFIPAFVADDHMPEILVNRNAGVAFRTFDGLSLQLREVTARYLH